MTFGGYQSKGMVWQEWMLCNGVDAVWQEWTPCARSGRRVTGWGHVTGVGSCDGVGLCDRSGHRVTAVDAVWLEWTLCDWNGRRMTGVGPCDWSGAMWQGDTDSSGQGRSPDSIGCFNKDPGREGWLYTLLFLTLC